MTSGSSVDAILTILRVFADAYPCMKLVTREDIQRARHRLPGMRDTPSLGTALRARHTCNGDEVDDKSL
jgi:hypothetical protein